jgi:linoleoyl-CoA desaturase
VATGSAELVREDETKVSFAAGGAFLRDLRADVDAHLAASHARLRGSIELYAKAPIAIGLVAAAWAVLVFARPGWLGIVACLAGIGVGITLVAFCVQHDANHGSYFARRRGNHLVGWSSDLLLGISSYAWRVKHNVAHHTYTNVDGYDDDIAQVPFARLAPSQEPRPWYRFQHIYMWPLYSFMAIRWQLFGDILYFRRGSIGMSPLRFPSGWSRVGLLFGKAFFLVWALAVPMLVYPWWQVVAAFVGLSMAMSVVMAVTFQLAHAVEEARFVSSEELGADTRAWAVHQVETTVDFCPRNKLLTWGLGGLNFQIEHHLFPRLPHTLYPVIAPIVARHCERHGVRYTTQPTLWAALRSHFRHLRELGRAGLRAELEMG